MYDKFILITIFSTTKNAPKGYSHKMNCARFQKAKKELVKLTLWRFESSLHERLWVQFEDMLLVHTWMYCTARNFLWLITAFLGWERYDRFDTYLEEKGGPPANVDAAVEYYSYAKAILYILYSARFFINIASLKWPKLFKSFYYIELLVFSAETIIPTDLSLAYEQMFWILGSYQFFWLGYFSFWIDLVCLILSFIPMYVGRVFYHEDPLNEVAFNAILMVPWPTLNIFLIHWVITKFGFLFIDAEMLRLGNDQLFDNLEEGVVILEE